MCDLCMCTCRFTKSNTKEILDEIKKKHPNVTPEQFDKMENTIDPEGTGSVLLHMGDGLC